MFFILPSYKLFNIIAQSIDKYFLFLSALLISKRKQMDCAPSRIFWRSRKFNQIDVRYAPSLCKLWHKACIANQTSLTLVLLVHGLKSYENTTQRQKNSKLAQGAVLIWKRLSELLLEVPSRIPTFFQLT